MTREDDGVKAARGLFATIERGEGVALLGHYAENMVQI